MQALLSPAISPRVLLAATLALAPSCAHPQGNRLSQAQAAASLPAPTAQGAQLSDVDLRLVAEAIAYDVSRAPWVAAWVERAQTQPAVVVGPISGHVAGAGGGLDGASFAGALAQALRNTGALEVLPEGQAQAPGALPWLLEVAVSSHDEALEGQQARIYSVAAQVRPAASAALAWDKAYPLRKRLRPVADAD